MDEDNKASKQAKTPNSSLNKLKTFFSKIKEKIVGIESQKINSDIADFEHLDSDTDDSEDDDEVLSRFMQKYQKAKEAAKQANIPSNDLSILNTLWKKDPEARLRQKKAARSNQENLELALAQSVREQEAKLVDLAKQLSIQELIRANTKHGDENEVKIDSHGRIVLPPMTQSVTRTSASNDNTDMSQSNLSHQKRI